MANGNGDAQLAIAMIQTSRQFRGEKPERMSYIDKDYAAAQLELLKSADQNGRAVAIVTLADIAGLLLEAYAKAVHGDADTMLQDMALILAAEAE